MTRQERGLVLQHLALEGECLILLPSSQGSQGCVLAKEL